MSDEKKIDEFKWDDCEEDSEDDFVWTNSDLIIWATSLIGVGLEMEVSHVQICNPIYSKACKETGLQISICIPVDNDFSQVRFSSDFNITSRLECAEKVEELVNSMVKSPEYCDRWLEAIQIITDENKSFERVYVVDDPVILGADQPDESIFLEIPLIDEYLDVAECC